MRTLSTPEERAELVRLYQSGLSLRKAAARFGRGNRWAQLALIEAGVSRRSKGEGRRTHTMDEAAFDVPTSEACYWAGFLMADGVILTPSEGQRRIRLVLAERDAAHVEAFRGFLKATHTLTRRAAAGEKLIGENKAVCSAAVSLEVASLHLAASLGKYGVTPRKTWTAVVPEAMRGNRDWWRGMIDGDGWVHFSRRTDRDAWRVIVGLTGTKEVCEAFAGYVQEVVGLPKGKAAVAIYRNGSIWKVNVADARGVRLADHLYRDAAVALPRKAEAVADMLATVQFPAASLRR